MKSISKLSFYLLLCVGFLFTACEKEEVTNASENQEVITQNSVLSGLMLQVTQQNSNANAITCIDFVYPVNFFIYDSNQQQVGTQTVNNDNELNIFLTNLEPGNTVSIEFPIQMVQADGTIVDINNNTELQNLISSCTSGGNNTNAVTDYLTDGIWYVTYFFDTIDETCNYNGYAFDFAIDNTATANNGANTINGTWNLTGGTTPDLNLFFGTTPPFDDLNEDWFIIEATQDIIRLEHVSGGNGGTDVLTFERTPVTGCGGTGGGGTAAFTDTLTSGVWYVNLYQDEGVDGTCIYQPYAFTFNSDQTVSAVSSTTTVNGTWLVTIDNNQLELLLNFSVGTTNPFEELNEDWDVTFFDSLSIQLTDISGGNGGTDYLNFGRQPYSGCTGGGGGGSAQALIDIMVNGPWIVQSYIEDGDDLTAIYTSYTLTFNADGTVNAVNTTGTISGTWNVFFDGAVLKMELNFNNQVPFDEFDDDWDVANYTDILVELEDVSGGNGGTDTLTFAKL